MPLLPIMPSEYTYLKPHSIMGPLLTQHTEALAVCIADKNFHNRFHYCHMVQHMVYTFWSQLYYMYYIEFPPKASFPTNKSMREGSSAIDTQADQKQANTRF